MLKGLDKATDGAVNKAFTQFSQKYPLSAFCFDAASNPEAFREAFQKRAERLKKYHELMHSRCG